MKKIANEAIYDELKRRIINMELKPGDQIVEKDLIDEFNVSRTPVREAILKLSQNGLLDLKPRIGTFVTQINLETVKCAYEVKKNLEALAAELAAKRAKKDQINQLYEIIDLFNNLNIVDDYSKCIEADQKFHKIVREASGNIILIEMLEELNIKTARFLQYIKYVISDVNWFKHSLTEMADSINDHDSDRARKTTEEHTSEYLEYLSKKFFS